MLLKVKETVRNKGYKNMNTEADEISYEDLNAAADYYDKLKTESTMMFRKLDEQETIEFQKWADENYSPGSEIKASWHPVVQIRCAEINKECLVQKD